MLLNLDSVCVLHRKDDLGRDIHNRSGWRWLCERSSHRVADCHSVFVVKVDDQDATALGEQDRPPRVGHRRAACDRWCVPEGPRPQDTIDQRKRWIDRTIDQRIPSVHTSRRW
jgi:hypothetical protein